MKVALEVWSSDFAQLESTCLRAEALGIDAFYYGESPHGLNLDCWTTLAALARSTTSIRIGPVITNVLPTYRSAALLAKQAETVAQISGNRLDFRTGVGAAASFSRPWWQPFGVDYPDYERRLADLRNALEVLQEGSGTDPGRDVSLPVTIAATGHRAMELAANRADVWETSFCTPSEFAKQAATMTTLAAGRPIRRSLEIDGFVSQTKGGFDQLLAQVEADRGNDEDLGPILKRALTGTPDQAVEHLHELASVGVDQIVVALHDPHSGDAIDALAETLALLHERSFRQQA